MTRRRILADGWASARTAWCEGVSSDRGNVALIFALLMPGLLVISLGAVELNQVLSDQRRTHDVADSAALMGALQLSVAPVGADHRAQAYAMSQLSDVARYAAVNVQAAIGQNNTMTVSVDTQRDSFFGNLFPVGGFRTHVASTAQGENTVPLCVLASAGAANDEIHVADTSQLQAGQCLVHSNAAIAVDGAASLQASTSEAATTATGSIVPAAEVSAPAVTDPFLSLSVNAACSGSNTPTNIFMSETLTPQTFTGPVNINGAGTITLASGEYYFCKPLNIGGIVAVTGADVVLVFANGATLNFTGTVPLSMGFVSSPIGPSLNLSGRQSGPLAGFALIADRTYRGSFTLQSDYITGLTGTVYVPTATLAVQGTNRSGTTSPWTVITAENVLVRGGAQLVINANYASSNVPVPVGVGNQRQGAKLMQ